MDWKYCSLINTQCPTLVNKRILASGGGWGLVISLLVYFSLVLDKYTMICILGLSDFFVVSSKLLL